MIFWLFRRHILYADDSNSFIFSYGSISLLFLCVWVFIHHNAESVDTNCRKSTNSVPENYMVAGNRRYTFETSRQVLTYIDTTRLIPCCLLLIVYYSMLLSVECLKWSTHVRCETNVSVNFFASIGV